MGVSRLFFVFNSKCFTYIRSLTLKLIEDEKKNGLLLAFDDKNTELVTAETAEKLPNVVEFTKMAKAIDTLNVSSKLSVEGLYPLTESNSTARDEETVKKIKLGLLDIENEIALESR